MQMLICNQSEPWAVCRCMDSTQWVRDGPTPPQPEHPQPESETLDLETGHYSKASASSM